MEPGLSEGRLAKPSVRLARSFLTGFVGVRRSNVIEPTLRRISGSASERAVSSLPRNMDRVRSGRAVTPSPASTKAAADGICSTSKGGSALKSQFVKAASVNLRTDQVRASASNG